MNPSSDPASTTVAAAAMVPPPQPPQPHRLSTSCDRHPEERFTGFCPSCLCERLSVLDQTNTSVASSSRKPPTISAAAIKALFKPSSSNGNSGNGRVRPGFFPELRRTKSFSASKNNEGFSGVFEPQRRSCDVRTRSSLCNLFSQDEQRNLNLHTTVINGGEIEDEPRRSSVTETVLEVNDEGEADNDGEIEEAYMEAGEFETDSVEAIEEKSEEIIEEREEIEEVKEDLKPMKDYIDLDSQTKNKPSVRRSFWSAASVFSKKLQKWKQKVKKRRSGGDYRPGSARLPVEKPIGRQLRDTQSEIADYGFGRRSCDTDPRFSLDAGRFSLDAGRFSVDIGRISLDDPRYSFDEPRASWDGSLIGKTTFPPAARPPPPPSMLSKVEDAPPPPSNHRHVTRSDMNIPVEEPAPPLMVNVTNSVSDPVIIPGGSTQTRDYYTDSSSRRRKSLDRSSSMRKTTTAAIVADIEEPMDIYSGSLRDNNYAAETVDNGFLREQSIIGGERKVNSNDNNKKSRRWGKWSILGLIYRKSVNKYEEEEEEYERYRRLNGGMVERSLSESWPELRNGGGGPRMVRSNSNVSWRSSGGGSARKVNGFERNKSSRYSPKSGFSRKMNGGDGGGGGGGWANSHGHSIARSVIRLY